MFEVENERGFSLLEILIGLALAGGLSLLGMQIFKQQTTGQRTVEANYEVASIVQQIKTVLSDPSNCANSLQGLNPTSGVPTVLKKEVNSIFENVYPLNTFLPGNIKITSYSLSNAYPGLASNETMLRINFSRGTNTIKDQTLKNLKIVYTVNGSGNILTCYAFNNNSDTYWIQSLVQPDDIYYMAGNVGVGISAPEAKLHVSSGDIFLTDQIINNYSSARSAFTLRTDNITAASDSGIRLYDGNTLGHLHMGNAGLSYLQSYGTGSIPPGTLGTSTMDFDDPANFSNLTLNPLGGNVGIGTMTPQTQLNIVESGPASGSHGILVEHNSTASGTPRVGMLDLQNGSSTTAPVWYIDNWNDRFRIFRQSNSTTAGFEFATVLPSGNVGIGTATPVAKLDVNGPIKVGTAPDLCDATIDGQQRYKADIKAMQFCNGTSWISMNGGGLDYAPLTAGLSWSSLTLSTSGGTGTSSGSPFISLGSLGGYSCGPLSTVSVSATGMTSSTKAALVSFASFDSSEPSPAARIFTTGNQFVGLVGQAGRGGDGRSFGAGGEIVIPLNGQQFNIQFCKNSSSATFYYAVKAFLN